MYDLSYYPIFFSKFAKFAFFFLTSLFNTVVHLLVYRAMTILRVFR